MGGQRGWPCRPAVSSPSGLVVRAGRAELHAALGILPTPLTRLGLRPERTAADRQEATIEEAVNMLHDSDVRLTYDHVERMIAATDKK